MRNAIVATVLSVVALVAASGERPRHVTGHVGGICVGVQPFCSYPQHAICTCDSFGMNCYWRCGQ